ncbi:MAG TPA: DUF2332 domain-containing protein [Gaiellaceae bacterium]
MDVRPGERALGALETLTSSKPAARLELAAFRLLPERKRRSVVAAGMRRQARTCRTAGSPFYGGLLDSVAADVERGGPCWRAVSGEMPRRTALPLRFMGAVHRLVLAGEAPELARFYPSASADPVAGDPWPAFTAAVAAHEQELRTLVKQPNQTNEVRRSAALACGFLLVARETELPLRLLELGASAGLNLRWDRYAYRAAGESWGNPASPVVLDEFTGSCPVLGVHAEVVERRGCDVIPIDAAAPESALTLRSLVWADQVDRLRLLEAALSVAADTPVELQRESASSWLPRETGALLDGAATVAFHSYVEQFFTRVEAARIGAAVASAGARATQAAPFAYMKLEPEGKRLLLRLRLWPGGDERVVASCTHHGADVQWLLHDRTGTRRGVPA